ncbi:MAG: hypothetical protein ACK4RN_15930 [Pseudorhodobacter sp.]
MLIPLFRGMLLVLALAAMAAAPALLRADTLVLTGVVQDLAGRPLPRQPVRLVLGSDPSPRNPGAGRVIVTDARGRFALESPVALKSRRVRLDSLVARHASQLLEIGFGFDLLGQPALHWVEFDFIAGLGPRRGIETFVAGKRGTFDQPLVFHSREQSWSIPGDPRGMRLTSPGTDVQVETWDDSSAGRWRLDLRVIHQEFTLR